MRYPAGQVFAARDEIQATYRELRGEAGPAAPATLGDTPIEDLIADRHKLHQVAKALSRHLDIDYLPAIERLARMSQAARTKTLASGGQPVTLSQALANAGIALSIPAVQRDAEHRPAKAEANAKTPKPAGEVDPYGRVRFGPDVDLDALLADDVAPMRAFRKASDMGLVDIPGTRDEARAVFAEKWRFHVDEGIDYVATLQLAQHLLEVEHGEADLERQAETLARMEREAQVREAEQAAQAAAEQARQVRSRNARA